MKVEQLMTKSVCTCGVDDTMNEAARIMWEHDCGFVPVVASGEVRRLAGVVTDRDACMAAYTKGLPLSQIRVGDVMSTRVASCRPAEDVHEAEARMRSAQVHRLPVLDDAEQLLGVISLADIAREAARERGSRHQSVTPVEIGETLAGIRQPREIAASSAQGAR